MPLTPIEQELQTLAKFKASQLNLLTNGVRIQRLCNSEIADLLLQAGVARFQLSRDFLGVAQRLTRLKPPCFRNSISRSYYAMYHCARSVAYVFHAGDDYEEHKVLHNGIPEEFPNAQQWRNDFKEARLRRNEADYDPYPAADSDFQSVCRAQLKLAKDFIAASEGYLLTKGCQL